MPKNAHRPKCALNILTVALLLLTACGRTTPQDNELTVISHGVVEEQTTDSDNNISDTEIQIPEGMETRYYSLSYSKRMQKAYDDVVESVAGYESHSLIPLTISTEDYSAVLETVRCEQLAFFFLDSRTVGDYNSTAQTFEINFNYKYPIKDINSMLRKTEQAAAEIIALTDDSMTDYEKLRIFHDYLVTNVESSVDTEYVDSIYGALVEKRALCEGYAKAFSYLCNLSGIENMIVTGSTSIDHMWNMVKLDDNWYHVDVGWDQPSTVMKKSCPSMILYQYFLADDDVISSNRTISDALGEPPQATDDSMSWYKKVGLYASSYDEALEIIEKCCRKCIDSGDSYFLIKLDSSNLYTETAAELAHRDEDGISDIDRIVERSGYTGRISMSDYYKDYRMIVFLLDTN